MEIFIDTIVKKRPNLRFMQLLGPVITPYYHLNIKN